MFTFEIDKVGVLFLKTEWDIRPIVQVEKNWILRIWGIRLVKSKANVVRNIAPVTRYVDHFWWRKRFI